MSNAKIHKSPKVTRIIECALALIREHGDHGLTMRQVAVQAEMSLSNVQYYFKNKNELLKGMVDYYFAECGTAFQTHMKNAAATSPEQKVENLIEYSLAKEGTPPEICIIFRELWAIAPRNEEINALLKTYYTAYAKEIHDFLAPLAVHPDCVPKAVSIILPFFEGYSVTSSALPLEREKIAPLLKEFILSTLTTIPTKS